MSMTRPHTDQESSREAVGEGSVRVYRRPMKGTWWLERRPYLLYMLREWTSAFVAIYALFLLVLLMLGPVAFEVVLRHPATVALHIPVGLMIVSHSLTWFALVPQVIVLWRGKKRISPKLIAGMHYAMWGIISVIVIWIVWFRAGGG